MKRLWIAVALIGTVAGLCVITTAYQHRRTEDMLALVDAVEAAYEDGDIPAARRNAEELIAVYDGVCRIMMCYVTHSDIAESQETVRMLPALLEKGGGEEQKMEIARLREELTHLRQIDDPLPWNIL
jgi:hypothetical protein